MGDIEVNLDLRDRAQGLMVGIAAGNLLGIPYEFGWDRESIAAVHPNGIREIDAERGSPDDDDLAQSILLAEASIAADALDIDDLAQRFWNWGEINGAGMGGLTNEALSLFGGQSPRCDHRNYVGHQHPPSERPPRKPNGCAAIDAARLAWEKSGRESAGNGSVMRCAPVALRWHGDDKAVVRNSIVSAAVTHWDPRCIWATVLVNLAVSNCLLAQKVESDQILDRARRAMHLLGDSVHAFGVERTPPSQVKEAAVIALRGDTDVSDLNLDHPNAGYVLKTMCAALWSARHPDNFEDGLSMIVSAGGDADTNGAIAGAVLGARFGLSGIPARWRDKINYIRDYTPQFSDWEKREKLEVLADRILESSGQVAWK